MAGIIHRVAGITMLLDFIYHQFYLLNQVRKGGIPVVAHSDAQGRG